MMGNSALISRMKDICVCVRMCVCVCTLNLGSVFTLPFVYHCSVCVAVNIRQQLNLRGWQTSASPTDCSPEGKNSRPEAPREDRDVTSTPTLKICEPPDTQHAYWGLMAPSHPHIISFYWLIMGTIPEPLQWRQTVMQQRSISVTNGTRIPLIGLHFQERPSKAS